MKLKLELTLVLKLRDLAFQVETSGREIMGPGVEMASIPCVVGFSSLPWTGGEVVRAMVV